MHAMKEYREILEHEDYQDLCANSDEDLFKQLGRGKTIPGLVGVGKRARLWPFFLESITEEVEPLNSRETSPLISSRQPVHPPYHPPPHSPSDVDDLILGEDSISVATKPRRSHIITNARYFAVCGNNGRYSIVVKEPPGVAQILPVTNNSYIYCDNNNTETPAIASGQPLCFPAPSTIGGPNVTTVNNNNPAQSLSCTGQSTQTIEATASPHTNYVNTCTSKENVIPFGNINGHVSHDSEEDGIVTTPNLEPYGYIGDVQSDYNKDDDLSGVDGDNICETNLEYITSVSREMASSLNSLFGPKPQKRVVIVRSAEAQKKHDEAERRRREGKDTKKRKKAVKIAVVEDDPNAPVPKSILKNMKLDKSKQQNAKQESLERIDRLFYGANGPPYEANTNFLRDPGNDNIQPIYANVSRGGTLNRRSFINDNTTELEGRYPSPIQYSEIQHGVKHPYRDRNGMVEDESHYKHPRKYVTQGDVHQHPRGQINGGGLHPHHQSGMHQGPSPTGSQRSLASTVSIQAPSVHGLTPEEQQLIVNLRHERNALQQGQDPPLVFPPGMNAAASGHSIRSTSTLHSQNAAPPRLPHRPIVNQLRNPKENPRGTPPSTLPREGTIPREMRQNVSAAPQQHHRDNKRGQQGRGHPQHAQQQVQHAQSPTRGPPQSNQQQLQHHPRHPQHLQHQQHHQQRVMGGDTVPPPLPIRDHTGTRRRIHSHPERKQMQQPHLESHYAVGDVRGHQQSRPQPQADPRHPQHRQQQTHQQQQHQQQQNRQQHQRDRQQNQQNQQQQQHPHQQNHQQSSQHRNQSHQQQHPHQEGQHPSLPRKHQQERMIQHQLQAQQHAPGLQNQGVNDSKTNSLPNMARQTPPEDQPQQQEEENLPTQKQLFQQLLQPPIPAKRTSNSDVASSKSSDSGHNLPARLPAPQTKMKETCFYWEPDEELKRERDMKFIRQESAKVATEEKQKKIKGRRAQKLANDGKIQLQGSENIQPQPKAKPRTALKETTLGPEPQSAQPVARREPEPEVRRPEAEPRRLEIRPEVDTLQITSAPNVTRRLQTQFTESYVRVDPQQQTNQQRMRNQLQEVLQQQQPDPQEEVSIEESPRAPPQHAYFSLTGRMGVSDLPQPSPIQQSDDDDFFRDTDDDNSMLSIIALNKEPRVRSGRRNPDESTSDIVVHVDNQQVTKAKYVIGKETVFSAEPEPDTEPNETESEYESSDPEGRKSNRHQTPSSEDEDEPLPLAKPSFEIIRYPPALSPAVSYTRSDVSLSGTSYTRPSLNSSGGSTKTSADAFAKHSVIGRKFYHSSTPFTSAQSKSESDLSHMSYQQPSSLQPASKFQRQSDYQPPSNSQPVSDSQAASNSEPASFSQPPSNSEPASRVELSPPTMSSSTAQTGRAKSESNLASVQITYEDFPARTMSTAVQTRPNHDFSSQVDLDQILYETSEPKINSISIQTSNERLNDTNQDPYPTDAVVDFPPAQTVQTEARTEEIEIQTMQTENQAAEADVQTVEMEIQTDDVSNSMEIDRDAEPRKVMTESAECQTNDLPQENRSLEFGGMTTKFVDMGMDRPRVHFDAEPAGPDNPFQDYSSPTYEIKEEEAYHQPSHEVHEYSPPDRDMQSQTHYPSESASYSDEDDPIKVPNENNQFPLPPEVMLMQAMPEPLDAEYCREDDELPVYPTLATIPEESEGGYSREHSMVTGTLSYTTDGDDYQRGLMEENDDTSDDDDDDDSSDESDDEDVETERTLENEEDDDETIHVVPSYSSIQPYRGAAVRVYVPSNSSSVEDVSSDVTLEREDSSQAGASPAVQVLEMPYIGTPVHEAQLKDMSFPSQQGRPSPSIDDTRMYHNTSSPMSSSHPMSTGGEWPGEDGFTAGVQEKKETLIDDKYEPKHQDGTPAHRTFTLNNSQDRHQNEWNSDSDVNGQNSSNMVEIVDLDKEPRTWGQRRNDPESAEFSSSDETITSNKQSKETDIPYQFEKEYLLELPSTRSNVQQADVSNETPGDHPVSRLQPEIVDTNHFYTEESNYEERRQTEDPFHDLTKDNYIEREEHEAESEEDNTVTVDENAPVIKRTAGGAFVIGLWGRQAHPTPVTYQEEEHEPVPEPELNAEPESGFESEQVSEPVSSVDNEPVKIVECQPVNESQDQMEYRNSHHQSTFQQEYEYRQDAHPYDQEQSQNNRQHETPYYQDQPQNFENQENPYYQGDPQSFEQQETPYYQGHSHSFEQRATPDHEDERNNVAQGREKPAYTFDNEPPFDWTKRDQPQHFEQRTSPYNQEQLQNVAQEREEPAYTFDNEPPFDWTKRDQPQHFETQTTQYSQAQPQTFDQQETPYYQEQPHNYEQQVTPYYHNQPQHHQQEATPYSQNQSHNVAPDIEAPTYTFDNEPPFDWTKREYNSPPSQSPEVNSQVGEVMTEPIGSVRKNISLFQSLEDRPIIDTSMPIQTTPEPNREVNLNFEPNIHNQGDTRENQFSSSDSEESSSSDDDSDEDDDDEMEEEEEKEKVEHDDDDDDEDDDDEDDDDEDENKVVSPLKRERSFVKKARIVQSDDEMLDDVEENEGQQGVTSPLSSSDHEFSPDPADFMNSYQQFVTQRKKSGELSPTKVNAPKSPFRAGPPPVAPKPTKLNYSSRIQSRDTNNQIANSSPSDTKTSDSSTHAPSPSDAVPKFTVSEPCPPDSEDVKQEKNQQDKPLPGKETSSRTPVDLGARGRRWSAGDTDEVCMDATLEDWRSEKVLVVTDTERVDEIISERTIRPKQRDDQFSKQSSKKTLPPKVFNEEKNKQESVCSAEQPVLVNRDPRSAPIPNLRLSVSAKDNLDVIADILAGRSGDNSNKQPASRGESSDEYSVTGHIKDHKSVQSSEEATHKSTDPRHYDSDTDSITTELTVPFDIAAVKGKRSLTPGPNLDFDAEGTKSESDWRVSSGGVIAQQLARMRETLKRMELPKWYRKSSHFTQIMSGDIRSLPAYRNHKPRQIMSGPPTPTGHRFFSQPTISTRMSFTREARLRTGFSPAPSVSPTAPVHSSWSFSELPLESSEPTPGFTPIVTAFSEPLRHDLSFSIGDEIHKDVRTSEFALPMNPELYRRASPDEDVRSVENLDGLKEGEKDRLSAGEGGNRERSRSVGDEEDPHEYAVKRNERIGGSAMFYISAVSSQQQQEQCVSPPLPSPPPPPPPPEEYYGSDTRTSPLPPPPPPPEEGYYNSRESSPLPPPPPPGGYSRESSPLPPPQPEEYSRYSSSQSATSPSPVTSPVDYHHRDHQRPNDTDQSRRPQYDYSGYHGDDESTLPRNRNLYHNDNGNNNNGWTQSSFQTSQDMPLLNSPTSRDRHGYLAGSSSPSAMIRSSNPQITASLYNQPHITVTDTSAGQDDAALDAGAPSPRWDQRATSTSFQSLNDARYDGGVQPPSVTMEEIVDSLLGLSTSRSPSNSFTEYSSYMDASSLSMTTTPDQSVSESDSSLETVISQDDVEAREKKLATQRVTSGGQRILKSIVINDGQDDEARNITRSRGGLSDISEEVIKVKCSYKRCSKIRDLREARKTYKTCHNCYTYYCSRDCRKAHWGRHKKKCLYGRVNSLCKHVIYHSRYNERLQEGLSRIARNGYLAHGRGAVLLAFSNVEEAYRYITQGLDQLNTAPCFLSARELEECGEGRFNSLQQTCYQFDPEVKFVLNVSIVASQDTPTKPLPRRPDLILRKCAKVRLFEGISRGVSGPGGDRETLILTAPPGVTSEEGLDMKARQVCFVHIQRQLRQRGVSLRHQFPVVYEKLCRWVEQNQHISPVTIYPRDGNSGKTFMCLIVPDTDQDTIEWVQNPEILETMDSVEVVDLDAEMEKVEKAVSNVALLQMTV